MPSPPVMLTGSKETIHQRIIMQPGLGLELLLKAVDEIWDPDIVS